MSPTLDLIPGSPGHEWAITAVQEVLGSRLVSNPSTGGPTTSDVEIFTSQVQAVVEDVFANGEDEAMRRVGYLVATISTLGRSAALSLAAALEGPESLAQVSTESEQDALKLVMQGMANASDIAGF